MANNTVWNPIQTIPYNKLVVVYGEFQSYHLRSVTNANEWYDDNGNCDDSGMEWDLWAELPERPGKNRGANISQFIKS